jgi:CHAT domain-containing protein/predicted negative regulator of RcsB-dependent stress response
VQKGPSVDALRKYLKGAPPLEPKARRALREAYVEKEAGRFRRALKILETVKTDKDTILQGKIWWQTADLHLALSAWEPRLAALQRWQAIANNLGWLEGEALAARMAGAIMQDLRRHDELPELYRELAEAQDRLGRPLLANEARVDRAAAYTALGQVRQAVAILTTLIEETRRAGRNSPKSEQYEWQSHEASAHSTMALALSKGAEYARALDHIERAEALWESLGYFEMQGYGASTAGSLFLELGDIEAAETALLRAQELIGDEDSYDYTAAHGNLGIVAWRRGDHDKALERLREALAKLKEHKDWVQVGDAHAAIGDVLISQGEYAEARESFDDALKHLDANPLRKVTALAGKAHACLLAGDLDAAQSVLKAARETKGGEQARLARNRLFEIEGRIRLARNQPGEAVACLRKAIAIIEDVVSGLSDQQTFLAREQSARVFQVAVEAAFRAGKNKDIVELLERGRAAALCDAIGSRRTLQRSRLPRELAEELEAAEANVTEARLGYELALQLGSLPGEAGALAKLGAAEERLRQVTNQAERKYKRLAQVTQVKPSSMREIQKRLRPDKALVYYALQGSTGYAFVLTAKKARSVTLENAKRIAQRCEEARAILATKDGAGAERILSELKDLLVTPLGLERLKPAVHRVIVCPDGPLSYLPWPELLEGKYGSSVPSGSTLVLLRDAKSKRGRGVLALGAPDYAVAKKGAGGQRGHLHRPLPESRKEVEGIADQEKGSRALLGLQATESALDKEIKKALKEGRRWRAVHFACHGLVDDRFPRRASLALTREAGNDGCLTIPEILSLDVRADLVVLSACRTGRGRFVRGEGVVGLTRAFMMAGAPRVLASTWRVDDAATRELMVEFYSLWQEGKQPAEALCAAQQHVKAQKKKGWDHPYYWAAWVLWGVPE